MVEKILPKKEEAVERGKSSLRGRGRANAAAAAVSAGIGIPLGAATLASIPDRSNLVDALSTDVAPWMGNRAREATANIGEITGIGSLERAAPGVGRDIEGLVGNDLATSFENAGSLGPLALLAGTGAAFLYAKNRLDARTRNLASADVLK